MFPLESLLQEVWLPHVIRCGCTSIIEETVWLFVTCTSCNTRDEEIILAIGVAYWVIHKVCVTMLTAE